MFGLLKDIRNKESMKKSFDEYKEQYPELSNYVDWGDVEPNNLDPYHEGRLFHAVNGIDPIESPINFDTLNTLTKEHYSPQARVKRMLLHAKIAAEKGSWWCNIPDVGEEEIALLKDLGFRVFRKESQIDYQYSLNWSDKSVTPKDTSLVEL